MPQPDLDLDIPPVVTASVLLAARQFALAAGISWPASEDILAATGVSAEEAHAIEDALLDQLAALAVMAKRQTLPPDLAGLDHSSDLTGLAFEMVGFRQFVLELRRRYLDVTMIEFAATIDLPLDTVEDWLRGGRHDVDTIAHAKVQRVRRGVRLA